MGYILDKFIDNILSLIFGGLLTFILTHRKQIKMRFKSWYRGNKKIRISLSYLFQIKDNDNGTFLLIHGNRIQQYQPVGGVYKYYDTFNNIKHDLHISDESNKHFFEDADLRIEAPAKNIMKILEWFKTRKNREITVTREFIEELIEPGLLDWKDLKDVRFEYISTENTGIRHSDFFSIDEYLLYDIFKVSLSEKVMEKLKKNVECNSKFLWVSQKDINTKNIYIEEQAVKIGEHAKYITTC